MNRAQFTFYRSYYDAIKELPKKDQTAVLLAVCAYALDNEEPKLSGTASAIFTLIRPTLDTGRKKAMGGHKGSPSKDHGKTEERQGKDTAKEKEGEKEGEKEVEVEVEVEIENECYKRDALPPAPSQPKPARHKYGAYSNVLLSDEELDKLKTEFPDWEARIERLSEYIASKGVSYKSHLATIRSWARKDEKAPVAVVRGRSAEPVRRKTFSEIIAERESGA